MAAKLGVPTDPAISFHPVLGDLAKLRELASSRATSVAAVLRELVHEYVAGGRVPGHTLVLTGALDNPVVQRVEDLPLIGIDDILAPSRALGHADPDDDLDIDALAERLGAP